MQRKIAFGWLGGVLVLVALSGGGSAVPPSAATASLSATPAMQKPKPEPTQPKDRVSADEYGEAWPLTVKSGRVKCIGKNGVGAAFFVDDRGTHYALNGLADVCTKRAAPVCPPGGARDIEAIWRPDPHNPALKVSIGTLIQVALQNCTDD